MEKNSGAPCPARKADLAVNIFAKPFQTALSILSLIKRSGSSIGEIWLQFEPKGCAYDPVSPYYIAAYLQENTSYSLHVSQPSFWLDLEAADPARFGDPAYRLAIRFQHAFENSRQGLLFLMHNDVFILKDIVGDLIKAKGDAFAIGQLGQCWNCPAANPEIARAVFNDLPCKPDRYAESRPGYEQLAAMYKLAREKGIFVRPYDEGGFTGEFRKMPWPLPECRVNEWACLIDLEKTRRHCAPFGPAFPPGAYRSCPAHNLDVGVPWFRDMHALGLRAKHFDVSTYVKHWVGTGNNTPIRYLASEDRALGLLRKHFPDYLEWLSGKCGKDFLKGKG